MYFFTFWNWPNEQNSLTLRLQKKVVLDLLDSSKLISRKNWAIGKSWYFHTVFRQLFLKTVENTVFIERVFWLGLDGPKLHWNCKCCKLEILGYLFCSPNIFFTLHRKVVNCLPFRSSEDKRALQNRILFAKMENWKQVMGNNYIQVNVLW